jgi:hypothetical protein
MLSWASTSNLLLKKFTITFAPVDCHFEFRQQHASKLCWRKSGSGEQTRTLFTYTKLRNRISTALGVSQQPNTSERKTSCRTMVAYLRQYVYTIELAFPLTLQNNNEDSQVFQKWNFINVINFQKWCSIFSKACLYVALFQEFVDTPVNGRPSLFRIDSVQRLLFPKLCWSINTKSIVNTPIVA